MKKIIFLLITVYGLLITPPPAAYAVICNPALKDCTSSTAPTSYVNSVLSAVISIFFLVGVIYFIWHIVFAGYHLIASEGDPKKWETGKNEIVYAFVGLFVIFAVFALLKFVGTVLGVPGLSTLTIKWPTL